MVMIYPMGAGRPAQSYALSAVLKPGGYALRRVPIAIVESMHPTLLDPSTHSLGHRLGKHFLRRINDCRENLCVAGIFLGIGS
jgi:hypothetical protein